MMRKHAVWRLLLALAVVVAAMTFGTGRAFAQAAGDATLVVPIDDSESGASYDQRSTSCPPSARWLASAVPQLPAPSTATPVMQSDARNDSRYPP